MTDPTDVEMTDVQPETQTQQMELDSSSTQTAMEKPIIARGRSILTPKQRRTQLQTANNSPAKPVFRPPPQPARPPPRMPDYSFTTTEHDDLLESLWSFGLQSASHPDGSLTLHATRVPESLQTRDPSHVDAYVRLFVFDLYASLSYIAPLFGPIAPYALSLDQPFLSRLVSIHSVDGREARELDLGLAKDQLELPQQAAEQGYSSAIQARHLILLVWTSRLRRGMLLKELAQEKNLPSLVAKIIRVENVKHVASEVSMVKDSASNGYAMNPALPSTLPLTAKRLDRLLDEFQRTCTVEQEDAPRVNAASNKQPTIHTPIPALSTPSHSVSPVLSTSLLRRIVRALTERGLPLKTMRDHMTQISNAPYDASCVDWNALNTLLNSAIPTAQPSDWRFPVETLLHHASQDYELQIHRSIRGVQQQRSILPPDELLSFRRSLLFWHRLRVRILEDDIHDFPPTPATQKDVTMDSTSSSAPGGAAIPVAPVPGESVLGTVHNLLEWISQYAPGLIEPKEETVLGGDTSHRSLDKPLIGALTEDPSILTPGGSLYSPSSLVHSSSIPPWWQIGLHDLVLLQTVDKVGLDPKEIFRQVNEDIGAAVKATGSSSCASATAANSISWSSQSAWLTHSRPIIRHRMGVILDPSEPEETLPRATPITEAQLPALMKRLGQLVPSLSNVATDELMNRLLQSVEVDPSLTISKSIQDTMDTSDAAAPADITVKKEESNPEEPTFHLAASVAKTLNYYVHSLPCFIPQSDLYGLLRTRFHEMVPSVAAKSALLESHLGSKRNSPSSTAGTIATPDGPTPLNPLKHADSLYMRPNGWSLTGAWTDGVPEQDWVEQSVSAVPSAVASGSPSVDSDRMDDTAGPSAVPLVNQDDADESRLQERLDARARQRDMNRRLKALYDLTSSTSATTASATQPPERILVQADGTLELPQRLSGGFTLHSLGVLHASHFLLSTRRPSAHVPLAATLPSVVPGPIVLFPLGFECSVSHQSFIHPDTLVDYRCSIVASPTSPSQLQFQIVASGDPSTIFSATTPQQAWESVVARIQSRAQPDVASKIVHHVDGLERFGLKHPVVLHGLLAQLKQNPVLAKQLESTVGLSELQAHVALLPPAQFYLVDPARDVPHLAALEKRWRCHSLRYVSLTSGLIEEPRLTILSPTSVNRRAIADAAAQAERDAQFQAHAQAQAAAAQAAAQAQQTATNYSSYYPTYGQQSWQMDPQQMNYYYSHQQPAPVHASNPYLNHSMIANAAAMVNAQGSAVQ